MRETFCIRFYCRACKASKIDGKSPIEVSLIVNGERQLWQLPKKCKASDFSTNRDCKMFCSTVETKLNEIYSNLTINDEPITAYRIKDIYLNGNERRTYTLERMFTDGIQIKTKENICLATYKKYKAVENLFYEATSYNKNDEANKVNYADILTFKAFVESKHMSQTSSKELQRLKYFFTLAFNSGKIKQNPFLAIKINRKPVEQEYLTFDEMKAISKLDISNDRLDKVRDLFLFMCFTGLEFADILALTKEDVSESKGMLYIKKKRVKTGIEYFSVLYEDAVEIWRLYEGELPIISNQKFNKYLKELQKMAGINKNLTSLIARHSYACFLLNTKGLSIDIVQKMLGHTNPKQSLHYAKMIDDTVLEANRNGNAIVKKHTETKKDKLDFEDDLEYFQNMFN